MGHRRGGAAAPHGRRACAGARLHRVARPGADGPRAGAAVRPAGARRGGGRAAPHALSRRVPEQGELSRPGHALDHGGGGRAAGRGTLARVATDTAGQSLGRSRGQSRDGGDRARPDFLPRGEFHLQ